MPMLRSLHAGSSLVGIVLFLSLAPGLSCVDSRAADRPAANPAPPPGRADAALAALEQELATKEAEEGKDHADLVPILLNLSAAHRDQGGWIPARAFAQRALEILRKDPGEEPIEVAGALDLLGTLDWLQGDYDSAQENHQRVLDIVEKRVGANHPAYATALNNLALVYLSTGKTVEAEAALQRALGVVSETFGAAAWEATSVQITLGELYLRTGRFARAEQILTYALTIRSEGLGIPVQAGQVTEQQVHFEMAPARNLLGRLYTLAGLYDEAETFLQDALGACESQLGKEHPWIERVLVNLAALAEARGDSAQAAAYSRRADEIFDKNIGFAHLPGSPRAELIEPVPPSRSGVRPYADARVGDWVVYGGADGTPIHKQEIVRMTPVVAMVLDSSWDEQGKEWQNGLESMVVLAADLEELFGTAEGAWNHERVRVKDTEVACLTAVVDEGEQECKVYLAPDAVPVVGLVRTECDGQVLLQIIDYHRTPQ